MKKRVSRKKRARMYGYRSGLEEIIAEQIKKTGCDGQYEQHKLNYVKPETKHIYTPDFKLPNGIFIETKGRWVLEDRKKILLVIKQHPEIDLRMVFQNAKAKIRKNSKTTYADFCDKNNITWADKIIPESWFN